MGFWQGKRTLVTGGAGFLGGALSRQLQEQGADVYVALSRFYDLRTWDGISTMFEDYRGRYGRQPEFLFHLAATCGGIGLNSREPGRLFFENAIMGIQLIEAARLHSVGRFVQVGTVCSYPKHALAPFNEQGFWDGYPEETNAPYGLAKKMLQVQLQAYQQQYGMRSVYVVPTNLYGPRDSFDPDDSHVIPALIRKCVEARENGEHSITVWGTGRATRDFLYVDDCAAALLVAAELAPGPQPINVGSGMEVDIASVARLIAEHTHFQGDFRFDHSKPDGQPRRVLNWHRARMLGWEPQVSLRDGLQRTVDWYEMARRRTANPEPLAGMPHEMAHHGCFGRFSEGPSL